MSNFDYGWPRYVSADERRAKAEKAAIKATKGGAILTPISPFRGAIAKTFWGKAWCDNLETYSDYTNRLPRGSTYVRNGSVIDLQVTPGEVRAQVMGSNLYKVSVSVTAVPEKQWTTICTDCSGSIDSLVELLQGKLSNAVMERICKRGTGLFPSPKEIHFDCNCPDHASMCKHIAAVLYGIGTRLDQQPELLFSLRQVDAKDLVQQAEVGLKPSSKRIAPGKRLDDTLLGDVFGIEMAEATLPAKPAARKAAAKNAVKAAVKFSAKPRSPAVSKTLAAAKKAAALMEKRQVTKITEPAKKRIPPVKPKATKD